MLDILKNVFGKIKAIRYGGMGIKKVYHGKNEVYRRKTQYLYVWVESED